MSPHPILAKPIEQLEEMCLHDCDNNEAPDPTLVAAIVLLTEYKDFPPELYDLCLAHPDYVPAH